MKNRLHQILIVALTAALAGMAMGEELTRIKGRVVGQKCAELGRIGECYLKWADPAVLWTEEGDIYGIDTAAGGIKPERLDEAYGLEVEAYGKVVPGENGNRLQIARLNILRPPGAREFFKG